MHNYLKYFVCLFTLVFSIIAFSQTELKSKIVDFYSYLPLENTSIYIENSTIGTISNTDGRFVLSVPLELENDTLVISSIGYKSFRILVSEFVNDDYSHFPSTIINAVASYAFPMDLEVSIGVRAMLDYETFQVSSFTAPESSDAPDFIRFNVHAEKNFNQYGALTVDVRNLTDADDLHVGYMFPGGGEAQRYESGRSFWIGWKYSL